MAHSLTIHQLVEQLRAGELSSRDVTQACLDRVEQVDSRLNAFISLDAADALAQASLADQARAGRRPALAWGARGGEGCVGSEGSATQLCQ